MHVCALDVAAGARPEVQQRQGEEELHRHTGLPAEHHQRLLAHGVPGKLQGDCDDHQRGGEREGGFALPGEMAQCGSTVLLFSSEFGTEYFVQNGCFKSQLCCCIPSYSLQLKIVFIVVVWMNLLAFNLNVLL